MSAWFVSFFLPETLPKLLLIRAVSMLPRSSYRQNESSQSPWLLLGLKLCLSWMSLPVQARGSPSESCAFLRLLDRVASHNHRIVSGGRNH